jgi:hypothetical protein
MTKADTIRLWRSRGFTAWETARETGYDYHYVYSVIWRADNPAYHREWMARKRLDPVYHRRELDAQIASKARRRRG